MLDSSPRETLTMVNEGLVPSDDAESTTSGDVVICEDSDMVMVKVTEGTAFDSEAVLAIVLSVYDATLSILQCIFRVVLSMKPAGEVDEYRIIDVCICELIVDVRWDSTEVSLAPPNAFVEFIELDVIELVTEFVSGKVFADVETLSLARSLSLKLVEYMASE